MAATNIPFILGPGDGTTIHVGNSKLFLKLSGEQAGCQFSVTEYELPGQFAGPPAHKHKVFEHAWYVLEGLLTAEVDGKEITITDGGFLFIPKKTVHAFSNKSDRVVRLLAIDTPGGFEKYYEELQTAFSDSKALDPETFRAIQLKYDTYPPDYVF